MATKFVKPGLFKSQALAKRAYSDVSLELNHAGGKVFAYYQGTGTGMVVAKFLKDTKNMETTPDTTCTMLQSDLDEVEIAWQESKCCGFVTRILGQDYIVVKTNQNTCAATLQLPATSVAIAWPTFNSKTFVKLNRETYSFKLDKKLTDLVLTNLKHKLYINQRCNLEEVGLPDQVWVDQGPRNLVGLFTTILFPVI